MGMKKKIWRKWYIFFIPIIYYSVILLWSNSAKQLNAEKIFTVFSIFPIVVVALWQEELKKWWFAPKLEIYFKLKYPLCSITPFYAGWEEKIGPLSDIKVKKEVATEAYYFRLKIINFGNSEAKRCEVVMTELLQEDEGKFYNVKHFQPVNIKWDVKADGPYLDINPSPVGWYIRLGYISEKFESGLFHLEYCYTIGGYQPTTLSKGVRYRFTVAAISANAKFIEKKFEFFWDGVWEATEKEMFKHIDFKEVGS